jgi:filamentous hemagglutinin family protein
MKNTSQSSNTSIHQSERADTASGQHAKNGVGHNNMRLKAIPFALAIAFGSLSSKAELADGHIEHGTVSISAMDAITTIKQESDRAILRWNSFNVNAGETVKFVQPSSTAAILNRVTGGSVSTINGLVEGNGRVYLINPNGIVVGANGVINVNGGFIASTRDVSNDAFINGGALVFTGESTGSIQVLGKVQSAQGDVILIAPKIAIEKTGTLVAGQEIKLVAANEVELSNGKLTVKPKAGDAGQITIEGALEAAKVQLAANNNNLGALAINTSGNIRATGTQINPDGSVSIIATGDAGNINISGNIRSEKGDGNGGAVTILADNGIRINGTINANSTDTSNANKKGGDIYIGRDVTTNKLARATDVSGATLLSNQGFVETSGDWLKTHNITVLAKDWLLDPTDITIVAGDTGTANTPSTTSGTITTFLDTTPIGASEVWKSTIETAINGGTSVTISTRNTKPGANGSGNITIATALSFNNMGLQDATFKLDAVNGITQNAGATITAVGDKKVNIEMVAEGKHLDVTPTIGATNNNSNGIVLNAAIKTNGSVIMDGTSFNTNVNRRGIDFKSGSSIEAESFNIKGQARAAAMGTHGVQIDGNTSFKSTGTGISTINGTSLTTSTGITGGTNLNGTNIKFDAAGTGGSIVVTGSNANTGLGVRISAIGDNTTVTTDGNVTFGELGVANSAFSMRAGSITANSGSLNILGSAVSNFGGESITANNGVSINIEGKTTAGSASNAVSFTNMEIKALAATGGTAGDVNINGTSSSGAAINLASNVTIQGGNVSLKGTSSTGAGVNGTGKVTATGGNVLIEGVTTTGAANGSALGVMTNNSITADNGRIDITGTTATTGREGVWINGHTLRAQNISVTGTATGGVGMPEQAKGIRSSGTLTATNAITLKGTSTNVTGVGLEGGSVNAGGAVVIDAVTTNGVFQGANIGAAVKGASVNITGNSRDHLGVAIGAAVTATNGNVEIKGTSVGNQGVAVNPTGSVTSDDGSIKIEGTSTGNTGVFIGTSSATAVPNINAKENVSITGISSAGTGVNLGSNNGFGFFQATIKSGQVTEVTGKGLTGVRVWGTSSINAGTTTSPGSIKILGETIDTTESQTGTGVDFQRFPTAASMNASKDIYIEGTLNGLGNGAGIQTLISGTTGQSPTFSAGENFTLRGNNRGASNNPTAAINAVSGLQVTAGKNIVLQAETKTANTQAMNFYSLGDGVRGNTSFVSTDGDVLIQSNQGSIVFDNRQTSSMGKLTDIKGRNITFDNTGAGMAIGAGTAVAGTGGTQGALISNGGSIDASGAIAAGTGKATGTHGINFADNRSINATGNLNIMGASSAGDGVRSIAKMEVGESLTIAGQSETAGSRAVVITNSSTLTGTLKVADGKTININANTLTLEGAATAVDAGTTGTVNIKTRTSGNEIVIGAADTLGTTLASQKLGIDQNELNRINAGKLVIGDAANTGGINVSDATTTLEQTGHVTLQTGGNISINAALNVGDATGTKNLTLNGAGTGSTINQSAAIKATGLELLGASATHTLTNVNNQVATLAVNSKVIDYVNSNALTLGAVNATTGINATGVVSIATQTGNLTIAENVNTTVSSATALVLNAGKLSSVGAVIGDDVGGNIVVNAGKTVGVGSGGVAQLMTGSITGDTSAAGLAASGKFRYNSDESNTNYNTTLSSGVNVIYREKPTLSLNVNSVSKTYDGVAFTGGNGFTEVTPSGLRNVDGLTSATASAVYGGSAQNAKNASSTPYTLSASESIVGKSALGYEVTYNQSELIINKAPATIIANSADLSYNGLLQTVSGFEAINLVNGENKDVLVNVEASGSGIDVGNYLTKAIGDDQNYELTFIDGTLKITFAGQGSAPTPPETYTRISSDIVNLAPVSFAVGIAPATASGEDDPNICYAWNQRGSGSVAVLSVLQPSYLGLRNAKTDNQEALSNGNGSDSDAGSPCLNDLRTSLALAGPF